MMYYVMLCACLFFNLYSKEDVLSITVTKAEPSMTSASMPIFIGILDKDDSDIASIVPILKADLERSGQFGVTVEPHQLPKTKNTVTDLLNKDYALAFYLNNTHDGHLEWRLYDTTQAHMVRGRKIEKLNLRHNELAHILAQEMWTELMGSPGSFLSKICYIKRTPHARCHWINQLCMCDSDGSHEQALFSSPHIFVAPYWNRSAESSFIMCSEFTDSNVRLVLVDMCGKKKIVLDFDGTTAGVSGSLKDGNIIYGRSGGIWRYHYDERTKRGTHCLLIREKDVCACPNLLTNGDIIYCSQGKIKCYHQQTGKREPLVGDGYNVGPSCHEPSHSLVCSRRVNKTLQLFLYNFNTKHLEQLTYDDGDKTDPCWSPCGNWVAFCRTNRSKSHIVALHVKTKKCYAITSRDGFCYYPSWSPLYERPPRISCR